MQNDIIEIHALGLLLSRIWEFPKIGDPNVVP